MPENPTDAAATICSLGGVPSGNAQALMAAYM
jgi:hypothetical protein